MTVDRYTKTVLTVIAAGVTALTVHAWVGPDAVSRLLPRAAEAKDQASEVTIPKSMGKLVGFSNGNLLLEAPDGTLREIDIREEKGARIKAIVRWN
jgi:hypothetical protein